MLDSLHTPPEPFNPDFRPKFSQALIDAYENWCERHPESTQDERKAAHAMLSEQLKPKYPTYGELQAQGRV